jgi:ADP-heptose:LPS heptosyltransferase
MTVTQMRRIDYWLGIPACFLLTGVSCLLKIFSFRRRKTFPSEKILFIKLSEMGSTILAHPLIKKAGESLPGSRLYFLTFKRNAALFDILRMVPAENVLTIREDHVFVFVADTFRAVNRMRRERIDIVFDLELFSRFTAILTYLSGGIKRVGFHGYTMEGLYRGNLLTHKVQYNPLLHISKSFLSLWQTVKAADKSTPELDERIDDREIVLPRFVFSPEAGKNAWNRYQCHGIHETSKLLLLNPGEGNLPLREWPLENFTAVAQKFLEDKRSCVIVIGTREASEKAGLLCRSISSDRCLDFTARTTLSEVLDLFHVAKALLANDCGLAHLASLTPIKKFILFGPESPQVYAPLGENTWIITSGVPCSPCLSAFNHRDSSCRDNRCLKNIRPEEVYDVIIQHISP